MRKPILKWTGGVLLALGFGGLLYRVVDAAWHGEAFYGTNFKGLQLGTYSTLAAFAICGLIGVVWLVSRLVAKIKRGDRS